MTGQTGMELNWSTCRPRSTVGADAPQVGGPSSCAGTKRVLGLRCQGPAFPNVWFFFPSLFFFFANPQTQERGPGERTGYVCVKGKEVKTLQFASLLLICLVNLRDNLISPCSRLAQSPRGIVSRKHGGPAKSCNPKPSGSSSTSSAKRCHRMHYQL